MKNPSGYCQCGCGLKTDPSPTSRRGYKRGEPLRFIRGHSSRKLGPDFEIIDGCWVWLKSVGSEGYGRVWIGERHEMAHRVYFERHRGPIPSGRELHHLCGNRRCVNPEHLQVVSRREHMAIEGRKAFGRYPVAA